MKEELKQYLHYLDDEDLTEEQKYEFLENLWNIVSEFVALGFNVHPLQQEHQSKSTDKQISALLTWENIEEMLSKKSVDPKRKK